MSENVYDQLTTDTYTQTFPANPSRQAITAHMIDFLSRHELAGPLVDFGCGTGEDGAIVANAGVEYFGNDLSIEMLSHGRRNNVRHTVACDLAELPYRDDAFGAGMSLWALQYKELPEPTLEEWRRVLRNGSPLLLVVPHPVYKFAKYSHNYFTEGRQWETGLGITRFNYYHTFSGYINSLIAAGFQIELIKEPRRNESSKQYSGVLKHNIPHDLIIEAKVEK